MHYTEYVVNMQKALPKIPRPLIPDAVRNHQHEATLPKLKRLLIYHKTSAINQEISANSDSRNDMHTEKFYATGVGRAWFIANEQGRL